MIKVLVIANVSDQRCGFANYSQQLVTALARDPRVQLSTWDGTYDQVYARQQIAGTPFNGMLPADVATYDVVHLVWHAMTMNHYVGAGWDQLAALPGGGPLISWFDGGPSDATCPFIDQMTLKWSDYPRDGYAYLWYPVPDWVDRLPERDPAFTVGASSVRGDGIATIRQIVEAHGWALNLPTPGQWLTLEDEVRRLARSTINVVWYRTPPLWHNRASAPSMLLAAGRPIQINRDKLVEHLWDAPDIYHAPAEPPDPAELEASLVAIHAQ